MKLNIRKLSIAALLAIGCSLTFNAPVAKAQDATQQKTLAQGDKAPNFSLKDQDGKTFMLSSVIGKKKLVIFFYPKDESPVCTAEACAFRDAYEKYKDADAIVIGINNGTVESHKAFATKNHLPFTLLSDPGNVVLNQFGVKEQDFGNNMKVSGRETFVIGLDGKIVYSFRDFMKGDEHSSKVLSYLSGK
jgi:peroxiredoxin Q/BCP